MTFDEFLEECRARDGWRLAPALTLVSNSTLNPEPVTQVLGKDRVRNKDNRCPLEAVFGWNYREEGILAGLPVREIMRAADGVKNEYREALVGLVERGTATKDTAG